MTDPTTTPPATTFGDDGRIASDVACVRCGYNLRTLRQDASCPECGTPIEHALHGNLLRYADLEWVGRLAKGMTWMARGSRWLAWCVALLIVTGIVLFAAFSIWSLWQAFALPVGWSSLHGLWAFLFSAASVTWIIGAGTGSVAILVGQWWITSADPKIADQQSNWNAGTMARSGLALTVLLAIAFLTINQWYPTSGLFFRMGLRAAAILGACAWIAGVFACIRRLALRIPDPDLAHDATRTAMQIFATTGLYLLASIASRVAALGPLAPGLSLIYFVGVLALLSSLNSAKKVLEHGCRQLRRVHDQARQNWNGTFVSSIPPTMPDNQP